MSTERDIAESYRRRAAELRAIAQGDGQRKTRETLERVAADYDRMALTMDGIATTNEAMRRH
jgi:hypothetical protein